MASFLRQRYLLVYKDSKCYVENSFAYVPEMTMDSRDKSEKATFNLWVCGKFSVTGRAHEQTFAHHIFSLPHKKLQQMYFSHKSSGKFSHVHEQIKKVTEKPATENVLVWTRFNLLRYRTRPHVHYKVSTPPLMTLKLNEMGSILQRSWDFRESCGNR